MLKRLLPLVALLLPLAALAGTAQAATQQTTTFSAIGQHPFTVPEGVTTIHVVAIGAAGGDGASAQGGKGLQVTGDISVTPGQVLYAEVGGPGHNSASETNVASDGGGGENGGGDSGATTGLGGAGGGGASDLRFLPEANALSLSSRLVVAPGGGGASDALNGGDGGAAGDGVCAGGGGGAGTQSAGGAGGDASCGVGGTNGVTGSFGDGGKGGTGVFAGGGGGGGYYGGGGGAGDAGAAGGGGGGSAYPAAFPATATTAAASVAITYDTPTAGASTPTAFGSQPMTTVSAPKVVTVTNTGDAPLVVHGETFTTDDFFVGSTDCGGTIPKGGTCEINVRFAPQGTTTGPRSATMHIKSNDPASPTDVSLSGTADAAPCQPGSLSCKGATGDQGPPGDPCLPSNPACIGPPGTNGSNGTNGKDGKDGKSCLPTIPGCRGPRGFQGPAGRDAIIACKVARTKRTKKLKVICTVQFANSKRAAKRLSMRLRAHGKTAAHAKAHVRHRRAKVTLRNVPKGSYRLEVVMYGNHHKRKGHGTVRVR